MNKKCLGKNYQGKAELDMRTKLRVFLSQITDRRILLNILHTGIKLKRSGP